MNQKELAKRLEISSRSLRNWKKVRHGWRLSKSRKTSVRSKSRADLRLKIKNEWILSREAWVESSKSCSSFVADEGNSIGI